MHNSGLNKFQYTEDANLKSRAEFNISKTTVVVGHCGRFNRQKNHSFVLRSFAKFHQMVPDSKLVLVGNGEDFVKIKYLAQKLGIGKSTIFTGYIDNVAEVQNMFDIFILPSLYEGLSLSLLENSANGTQCLLSDQQTKESYFLDSTYKLSIKDGAEQIWADKMFELVQQDLDKKLQSVKNIEQLEEMGFSEKKSVASLIELYEK